MAALAMGVPRIVRISSDGVGIGPDSDGEAGANCPLDAENGYRYQSGDPGGSGSTAYLAFVKLAETRPPQRRSIDRAGRASRRVGSLPPRRDAALTALGYRVVRLTWHDVVSE